MPTPTLKLITWQDIAARIKEINPEFYQIVNALSPDRSFRLYEGSYPFGAHVLRNGKFQVPHPETNSLQPLSSPYLAPQLKADLSYNIETNPVSLVLEHSFEIYMLHPLTQVPVTLTLAPSGSLLSISRVISTRKSPHHPAFLWNMVSGARSLYLLPKISQVRKFRRLKSTYGINCEKPTSPLEHWQVFTELSAHPDFTAWESKLLFFSKKWFEYLDDPAWLPFRCYLLEKFKSSFEVIGNFFIWDMVHSLILRLKDIKTNLFVSNTVKHLIRLAAGALPGVAPMVDDSCGPIEAIQRALIDCYGLTDYYPTVLGPAYFKLYEPSPAILYSLQLPNLLEDAPRKKDNHSIISDTHDIASLLDKILRELNSTDFNMRGTPLEDIPKLCKLCAHHPEPAQYSKISDIKQIFENDQRYLGPMMCPPSHSAAVHSPILNGVFNISHLNPKYK